MEARERERGVVAAYSEVLVGVDFGHEELSHVQVHRFVAVGRHALIGGLLHAIMQEPVVKVPGTHHESCSQPTLSPQTKKTVGTG